MVDPAHARGVFGRPVAAVLVAGIAAPAIVNHYFISDGRVIEKPCEQFGRMPVGRGHLPLAVAEDDRRLVARDQVFELRERSEERRVGKECRSRWWQYHSKKKA